MTEPFVVFDLDDTLYLERDFAFSGYRLVGDWIRNRLGVEDFEATCRRLFDQGERRHIFDRALAEAGVPASAAPVAKLVELYRGHVPRISLLPDADRALHRWGDRTGLITDGPPATQGAKVRALGLEGRIPLILLTGLLGPGAGKPSPVAFMEMERLSGMRPESLVYVADNPSKDFAAPRRRGWFTVMIERPGRIHRTPAASADYEAERRLATLDDLEDVLNRRAGRIMA